MHPSPQHLAQAGCVRASGGSLDPAERGAAKDRHALYRQLLIQRLSARLP
jgi:hypothetical protein